MLAHLADQFADRAVRIVCAAATEEERGILFPECVKPSIGTGGLHYWSCGRLLAADSCQKACNLLRRIGHFCDVREIDPGEKPEKIERRIDPRLWQDHRHDCK